MDLAAFETTLDGTAPPPGTTGPVRALWFAAKGDWEAAHRLVMDEGTREAAWVHAYLHRVEGDLANARYWYGQAGKGAAAGALADEWRAIAAALLAGAPPG